MKTLDPIVTIGDVEVAAIIEKSPPSKHSSGRCQKSRQFNGSKGYARKQPVAVIMRIDGNISAFSSSGKTLSLEAFDSAYPGLRRQFERETRH